MARQRKIPEERKKLIKELLSHYEPESVDDVQDMLKDLLVDTFHRFTLIAMHYFLLNNEKPNLSIHNLTHIQYD